MATVWPFPPQFRVGEYNLDREYKTEIITSRSGREQRRALRDTPRKHIEYKVRIDDDCRREFDAAMLTAQRTEQIIPERVRYATTTSTINSGTDTVTINPLPSWIQADAELMFVSNRTQETVTVLSISVNDVTFTANVSNTWNSGSRIYPALTGYIDASIRAPLVSRTKGLIEPEIVFDVNPGSELEESDGTASDTLSSREIFLKRPDKFREVTLDRDQDGASRVDFGFGTIATYFPVSFSTRIWRAVYTSCDFDHAETIRQLFQRMKGQRGEFYMPTFTDDMTLASAISSGTNTMTVSGTDIYTNYNGDAVFKAVAVFLTDGTTLFKTVSSIASSSPNSVITVGSNWSQNVAVADIDMICWMPVWRFASDLLTMTWPRETFAQISLSLKMLEGLAAET